jgi:hypothetical protein
VAPAATVTRSQRVNNRGPRHSGLSSQTAPATSVGTPNTIAHTAKLTAVTFSATSAYPGTYPANRIELFQEHPDDYGR